MLPAMKTRMIRGRLCHHQNHPSLLERVKLLKWHHHFLAIIQLRLEQVKLKRQQHRLEQVKVKRWHPQVPAIHQLRLGQALQRMRRLHQLNHQQVDPLAILHHLLRRRLRHLLIPLHHLDQVKPKTLQKMRRSHRNLQGLLFQNHCWMKSKMPKRIMS